MSQNGTTIGVSINETDVFQVKSTNNGHVTACIIGTANSGPAFVPILVESLGDFYAKFGKLDSKKFGQIAASEWLKNSSTVFYLRVLGIGDGNSYIKERELDAGYILNGGVNNSGFIVGAACPGPDGNVTSNPYSKKFALDAQHNVFDSNGRVWFLGSYVSESAGTSWLTDAGLERPSYLNQTIPIVRAVIMTASGTYLQLSASVNDNNVRNDPVTHPTIPDCVLKVGSYFGDVRLADLGDNQRNKQEFVLFINGHRSNDSTITTITASFDMNAQNYFLNVLNKDPTKIQQAGHYLYAHWDIPTSYYHITGTNLLNVGSGFGSTTKINDLCELDAFVTPGTLLFTGNLGTQYSPNYENWRDRFRYAKTPWVTSQTVNSVTKNLFRLHALSAGTGLSTKYKFSIQNITPGDEYSYGTFDLLIRDWSDFDDSPKVIERFSSLNLDPKSDRYISKVIGDLNVYYDFDQPKERQKLTYVGLYPNNSNIVRVEVSRDVAGAVIDPNLIPMGVRGYPHFVLSGSSPMSIHNNHPTTLTQYASDSYRALLHVQTPPVPMRSNLVRGLDTKKSLDKTLHWGVQFEHPASIDAKNDSKVKNTSLESFAKYYPDFQVLGAPFVVWDNEGVSSTEQNGICDADRFHNNRFSLEKIRVITGSNGLANPQAWESAIYVRNGVIPTDQDAKVRALSVNDLTNENRPYAKFTFFMHGGFDGIDIQDAESTDLNNTSVLYDSMWSSRRSRGGITINDGLIINEPATQTTVDEASSVSSYLRAIDVVTKNLKGSIGVIAVPGISHSSVTDVLINDSENILDCLCLIDIEQYDSTGEVGKIITSDSQMPSTVNTINAFNNRGLDTSFAAAYFPDVFYRDDAGHILKVPATVAAIFSISLNDKIGFSWTAPAGSSRGVIKNVIRPAIDISKDQLDNVVMAGVNPVCFDQHKKNVVIFGQKTLAKTMSLGRINVRRLMIDLRRQIREIGESLTFERNKDETINKFLKSLLPRLQTMQSKGGISKYNVMLDPVSSMEYDIVEGVIKGKIFIQPVGTIEFVSVDFTVKNNIV